MKKYVVVACGSGIATSSMVVGQIQSLCQEHQIEVDIHTCTIMELPYAVEGVDLIVTTSKYKGDLGRPIVNGVPLLTGIGKDGTLHEILEVLRAEKAAKGGQSI
jgi:PTS system galactitol-specific IIB component